MRHCTQVRLDPIIRPHAKKYLRFLAGHWLRGLHHDVDVGIFGVLTRQIRSKLGRFRWGCRARYQQRIDDQLRRAASG